MNYECDCVDVCCNCCYVCRRSRLEEQVPILRRAKTAMATTRLTMGFSSRECMSPINFMPNYTSFRPSSITRTTENRRYREIRAASARGRLQQMESSRNLKSRPRPKRNTGISSEKSSPDVNVATFCDWSTNQGHKSSPTTKVKKPDHDPTRYSITIGGNSNSFPNRIPNAANVAKMKQYYSSGVRILNGRVYCRERMSLTKGEREIISGIVQNRGDILPAENVNPNVAEIGEINSHRDAWLIGKQVKLEHPVIKTDDPLVCRCHFDEYNFSRTGCYNCNPSKVYCTTCKLNAVKQRSQKSSAKIDIPAPPSSPDGELIPHRIIPPINSDAGAVVVRDIVTKKKTLESHSIEKKTKVEVYLPRLDSTGKNPEIVTSDGQTSPKEANILIIDSLNFNEEDCHNRDDDDERSFSLKNMSDEIDSVAGAQIDKENGVDISNQQGVT